MPEGLVTAAFNGSNMSPRLRGQGSQVTLSSLPQKNAGQVREVHNLPSLGLLEGLGITEWTAQAVSPERLRDGAQWSVWPGMLPWPTEAMSTKE